LILHRLLFREIIYPLVMSLVLVAALLIVLQMLTLNDVLFGSGFQLMGVLRIASYLGLHFGVIAIPLAFLLAIMLGLGRLGEDNELIALGSLGRSPFALYVVPLLMGSALGLVGAYVTFFGAPWGVRGIHQQLNELIKRNVANDIHPNVFFDDIPRFTIYVGGTSNDGQDWQKVFLYDSVGDGSPLLVLSKTGQINSQGSDALLRLGVYDGELHREGTQGGYTRVKFEDGTVALGVGSSLGHLNHFNRPAGEMAITEMPAAIRAAKAAGDEGEARFLSAQYNGRLSQPFTCLIFGLIAVPLAAIGVRSRGASFGATLAAFIGYYVLQTLGNGLGETGRTAAWVGAWLPNGVGLAVALVLAWRLRNGLVAGARH